MPTPQSAGALVFTATAAFVRAWLAHTVSSVLACWAGLSFVWPVSLTALGIALDPVWLPHLRSRMGDTRPIATPLRWLIGTAGRDAQFAQDARYSNLIAALSLLPGLLVASLCALALPIAPFQHGLFVAVAVSGTSVAWLATGALTIALAKALSGATVRWRSAVLAELALAVPLFAFALFQGAHRPSPDRYWNSLVHVADSADNRRLAAGAPLQAGAKPVACEHDSRRSGVILANCLFSIDERLCIGVHDFSDICPDCMSRNPSIRCPDLEIRRELRGGRMIMARHEHTTMETLDRVYYPGLLFGISSAYVVELDRKTSVANMDDTNQGPLASALALRDAVAVPWPWLLLAGVGIVFVGHALYRTRPRTNCTNETSPAEARVAHQDPDGSLRYLALVLLVFASPMAVSIAMGVGR
jgi:hypothetical protein